MSKMSETNRPEARICDNKIYIDSYIVKMAMPPCGASGDKIIITRAPRGTGRSPEYNEHFCYKLDSRVKKLTTEWNEK